MNTYKRHRYPPQIISHTIWLYHRFTLSFRDVEEILASRGIIVSYESIRQWCLKFTPSYAKSLRKKQGQLGDQWFLDEVFIKINGKQHYLWRAVDQDDTTRYHNNIAENSHQKTRQQQRQMRQFKSLRQAQRFLSCHGVINNHFRQQRHLLKANHYRFFRDRAFDEWAEVTCAQNLGIAA